MGKAKMGTEEGWVGIAEVASHLSVAKESIYRWIESKGLPAHRVGRLLRFRLSEVDEWVKRSGAEKSKPVGQGRAKAKRGATRKKKKDQ